MQYILLILYKKVLEIWTLRFASNDFSSKLCKKNRLKNAFPAFFLNREKLQILHLFSNKSLMQFSYDEA